MASKQISKKKKSEEEAKLREKDDFITKEKDKYAVIPPDGGFGWVVALAAMLCNLVCDGTLFAFGTMKIHLQNHFQCSDMLILMVGSVPCGVYLLVGPLVAGLANLYGCRPIIIIGSIGASICMAASTLSPNVWAMMLIYGVLGGIFFGMVYLPSVVMVSFYFDKKRDIANGLVTAGTGIGALSFGPLADILMSKFGWKIGMLIFAGIMLSCILFGAIMKPLKPQKVSDKYEIEMEVPVKPYTKTIEETPSPPLNRQAAGETNVPLLPPGDDSERISSTATVPSGDTASGVIPNVTTVGTTSSPLNKSVRSRTLSANSRTSSVGSSAHHRSGVANPEDASRPLYKKDALFTGSVKQLHHASRTSLNGSNEYIDSIANIPAAVTEEKKKESTARAFGEILHRMTDLSILKNKQMLLICIGNIFSMLGYYLPIMCLVSFAVEDNGVNRTHASFLLTIFGACNTIGRFLGGPIAMLPHLSALSVHNAFLFAAGILTVLAAYANNFVWCALYAAFCGFTIAPHMSLLPSVICKSVGLDNFTQAFGTLFLFRGFTSIIGPPAAGFLKDYTKNYSLAFAIGGAMIIIASFFHISLACVEPPETEENNKEIQNAKLREKNKLDV